MTKNRIVYLVLVLVLAGVSALSGAAVGGVVVYRTVSHQIGKYSLQDIKNEPVTSKTLIE